jgi:MurNAc alpha-1-phosphate uridylyltransferase
MPEPESPVPASGVQRDLPGLAATEALAAAVAGLARPGDVILLEGPFGAGKTAFARAFLRAASADAALEVPSPSFTLVQSYDTRLGPVHHFDLWRLDGPASLTELGWEEARADIVLAEWPERLGALRPPEALEVRLSLLEGEARRAGLSGWPTRIGALAGAGPRAAMLLAAGLGTRMRPLTDTTAKPLLTLGGRTLLDHALDRLGAAGVERVVVNTHWHADAVAAHLAARAEMPRTVLRREEALLDTGGGVLAALDMLGPDPFFVVNGDSFWLDGPTPALDRLSAAWDAADADALLLVHRTFETRAETGPGDFFLDPLGTVRRRREGEILPYIYAGIQLVAPRLLAEAPQGRFSMTLAWDRAIAAGRLRAIVHDGLWFHLSTPLDRAEAEATLSAQRTGDSR